MSGTLLNWIYYRQLTLQANQCSAVLISSNDQGKVPLSLANTSIIYKHTLNIHKKLYALLNYYFDYLKYTVYIYCLVYEFVFNL